MKLKNLNVLAPDGLKILGVIPARWHSTRLPGKPLADINGKSMIQHVYERAKLSKSLFDVIVATDDERVFHAVKNFGGKAVMTSKDHPNGTSRVAEAVEIYELSEAQAVINIQGDEPLLNPVMIDEVSEILKEVLKKENLKNLKDENVVCATLCAPFKNKDDAKDINAVKVVMAQNGDALYFSRSVIPFERDKISAHTPQYFRHIGIYGYKMDFLKLYAKMPMTPLAEAESLEQLKILENGYKIRVKITSCKDDGRGVDTPEDLEAVRKLIL